MAIATFTKTGNKATTAAKLDKSIFGVSPKSHELIKQAYVSYLSNGRENGAQVKTRGLVSGGGRKPWKQKGTGRARFGSSRNPIWRGGGIVFGPTGEENYTKKMTTKSKRVAIRQSLSLAADAGKISVLESFAPKDAKTSEAVKLLTKIGAAKNILLVVENKTPEITRATSNIQNLIVTQATYVNTYDVLNADSIIITADALNAIHAWLSVDAKATATKGGEK